MSEDIGLPISHRQRLWLYALSVLVLLFLIAPSVIIVIMSFSDSTLLQFPPQQWSLRWYQTYFQSLEWRDATIVSVKVAVMTTLVATPLGTAAAYTINRGTLRQRHHQRAAGGVADHPGDPDRHRHLLPLCADRAQQHADRLVIAHTVQPCRWWC